MFTWLSIKIWKSFPYSTRVDLPSADVDRVVDEIEEVIGIEASGAVMCSAKTGLGIREVLESLVLHVPPPTGKR